MPNFFGPEQAFTATLFRSNLSSVPASDTTAATAKIAPNELLFKPNSPSIFPVPDVNDWVARRLLKEYGAIFVAQGNVVRPPKIIFMNADDCANWQAQVNTRRENIGGITIELQTEAMQALLAARTEATRKKIQITPRGTWAARRKYHDTEKIWSRRVVPGLAFWQRRGKLSAPEAARIRGLAPSRQVKDILQLEARGLYFSKNFSKSILYSGTAPGASQHIAMLALDINEHNNAAVRAILARHGWFQTVISDLPHFTYLGTTQDKLPALGLKKTVKNKRVYWTPA
ncbi:MAG: hypothetical protein ACO1OF_19100 [Adhaeribacter sp.]